MLDDWLARSEINSTHKKTYCSVKLTSMPLPDQIFHHGECGNQRDKANSPISESMVADNGVDLESRLMFLFLS